MIRPFYLIVVLSARVVAGVSTSSESPDARALMEDFAAAFRNAVKEVNKASSLTRNGTITDLVDEIGDLLVMLESLANKTLTNWAKDIDEETTTLYTGLEDLVKTVENVTIPQPMHEVEEYIEEQLLPNPKGPTVPMPPKVTLTTARPATSKPNSTQASNETKSSAGIGNQTNTHQDHIKIPFLPNDIFERPRVGGKGSPLFDDSRPRRTIQPLPIVELLILLSAFCLAMVGGHFCIKARATADRNVGYISRLPRSGGGTLECEANPTVDRFLAVFAYRRFVQYGQGAKLEIRRVGADGVPEVNRVFDIESLVKREGYVDQDDRAKLEDFLHTNNALEAMFITKEVNWPDFQKIKDKIVSKLRDAGVSGDIEVNIHDTPENLLVRQNSTWARFIRDRTTMALMALSLIGLVWYVPYTWVKSKRKSVVAKFRVKMSGDGYWRLIREKVNAMALQASSAPLSPTTTAVSGSGISSSEIDV